MKKRKLIMKEHKYKYDPKNKDLHLEAPLLEPSTHTAENPPRNLEDDKQAIWDVMAMNMKLGLMGYEELRWDRSILKSEAVEKKNMITDNQFSYLDELTDDLPGHKTTQILLAMSIIRTQSLLYSFLSIFVYYLPSLILTIILSQLDRYYNQYYAKTVWSPHEHFFLFYLVVFIVGVSQAVIALLTHNAVLLFQRRNDSMFNMVLILVSALIDSTNNSFLMKMIILLLWGGLYLIRGEDNKLKDKPVQAIAGNINVPYLGKPALYTFIALYLISVILLEVIKYKNVNVYLAASFFRIGSLTTTGGHSIIPLVLSEYYTNVGALEILKGFSFVSLLPGPMFNLAAFIGGITNGIFSALISVLFIVLPGVLLLMAILPYPEKMKYNSPLRNFLIGLNLASIGFIFAAAYKLFRLAVLHNHYIGWIYSVINIIICFVSLYSLRMIVPLVLLLGGGLAMLYSLVYTQMFV